MDTKVWFITGTSRGFGRIWAEAALDRGDKVAATARNLHDISELVDEYGDDVLPLKLDVNNRDDVFHAVNKANDHFGRLDIVVNNAGYGLFGMIEEVSEEEARQQIETNLFGALWGTQAAIPIMRKQGHGHILQVSSIGGVTTFPIYGIYHASKWGLEGFSETAAREIEQFGIDVTIIEPGGFATDWGGDSAHHAKNQLEVYDDMRKAIYKHREEREAGDPEATADAILKVVDAEDPPLRLFLGDEPYPLIKKRYKERLQTWEEWKEVSAGAQHK